MNTYEYIVDLADVNERVDKIISAKFQNFTRSQIQKLCDNNQVFLNNSPVNKKYKLQLGDRIHFAISSANNKEILVVPEKISLKILWEDSDLAVIHKPQGMLVYPTEHQYSKTLVNGLLYHYGKENLSTLAGEFRPGIVHRLDKNTSGLLLIAKSNIVHEKLNEQMLAHDIKKEYLTIVHGNLEETNGIINKPIGRDLKNRTRMGIVSNGRNALTEYTVEKNLNKFALLRVNLITGRTHQIRVHMSSIGHPVAGDSTYGSNIKYLKGQCLHAERLTFAHPITGEYMTITDPLPKYFTDFLNTI